MCKTSNDAIRNAWDWMRKKDIAMTDRTMMKQTKLKNFYLNGQLLGRILWVDSKFIEPIPRYCIYWPRKRHQVLRSNYDRYTCILMQIYSIYLFILLFSRFVYGIRHGAFELIVRKSWAIVSANIHFMILTCTFLTAVFRV